MWFHIQFYYVAILKKKLISGNYLTFVWDFEAKEMSSEKPVTTKPHLIINEKPDFCQSFAVSHLTNRRSRSVTQTNQQTDAILDT